MLKRLIEIVSEASDGDEEERRREGGRFILEI